MGQVLFISSIFVNMREHVRIIKGQGSNLSFPPIVKLK